MSSDYCKYNIISFHFTGATAVTSSFTFGQGSGPIIFDDIQCTGLEYRLIDCVHSAIVDGCSHTQDAGVICIAGKKHFAEKVQ